MQYVVIFSVCITAQTLGILTDYLEKKHFIQLVIINAILPKNSQSHEVHGSASVVGLFSFRLPVCATACNLDILDVTYDAIWPLNALRPATTFLSVGFQPTRSKRTNNSLNILLLPSQTASLRAEERTEDGIDHSGDNVMLAKLISHWHRWKFLKPTILRWETRRKQSYPVLACLSMCVSRDIQTIGALEGLSSGKAPSTLCCVYCPDASNSSYDVRHQMCMGRLISLPSSDSRGYPWTSCLQYYWRNNARRGKSCTPHQEDSSQSRSAAAASTVRVSIKEYDSERYCIKF